MLKTSIQSFLFSLLILGVPLCASAIDWSQYAHLDPLHVVPTPALQQAVLYYDQIREKISNPSYLTVIDYTQHSSQYRFYLVHMPTGQVHAYKVAHGQGSDANNDGWADQFSNQPNSKATSIGYYLTAGTYIGKHGTSLYLEGLSQTNSNARKRSVVIHGANYVSDQRRTPGRSWGCPALDQKLSSQIINIIKGGSLIYAWGGQKTREPLNY